MAAHDSTAKDLAARVHQKWQFSDLKRRILWHIGLPWHCPSTYLMAKKGDKSP